MATLNHNRTYTDDIAFNTQPGHIPLRDRVIKQNDRAYENLSVAKHFEEKAESLRKVRVKGDAEKRWQGMRDLNVTRFKVGDVVDCGMYAPGKILKINKKTAKIEGRFGNYNVDLAFLKPLEVTACEVK